MDSPFWIWLLFFVVLPSAGLAREISLNAVPVAVAGTLSPFTLTVNGKTIRRETRSILSLRLEDRELPANEDEHHSFFAQDNSETLHFYIRTESGEEALPVLRLPQVLAARQRGSLVVFELSGEIAGVSVNDQPIRRSGQRAIWRASVSQQTFALELKGPPGTADRLYNFRLSPGASPTTPPYEPYLSLANFRAAGLAATQSSGGNSLSGELGWWPALHLSPEMAVEGKLGLTALLNTSSHWFPVIEAEGLYALSLVGRFGVEAGGGVQEWIGYGGLQPAAVLDFTLHLHSERRILDLIYFGMTRVFADVSTTQLAFGMGLAF